MKNRTTGLVVGFALLAGVALGDIAEPAIQAFKDRVMVVLEKNGPGAGIHQAIISVPMETEIRGTNYQWRYDVADYMGTNPVMTFEGTPGGVTATIHLGATVPGLFGGGPSEIRTVRVVYGPDQAVSIPAQQPERR